jgi:hypothetical protein
MVYIHVFFDISKHLNCFHQLNYQGYTNARMQLFMSITPYTVISIENLLFGPDNLTDENNLRIASSKGHLQVQLRSLIIFALNKSAPSELL